MNQEYKDALVLAMFVRKLANRLDSVLSSVKTSVRISRGVTFMPWNFTDFEYGRFLLVSIADTETTGSVSIQQHKRAGPENKKFFRILFDFSVSDDTTPEEFLKLLCDGFDKRFNYIYNLARETLFEEIATASFSRRGPFKETREKLFGPKVVKFDIGNTTLEVSTLNGKSERRYSESWMVDGNGNPLSDKRGNTREIPADKIKELILKEVSDLLP